MSLEHHWIDVKTIAEIKEVTPRALRLALKKGKYTNHVFKSSLKPV